jgi:hypothetical protein
VLPEGRIALFAFAKMSFLVVKLIDLLITLPLIVVLGTVVISMIYASSRRATPAIFLVDSSELSLLSSFVVKILQAFFFKFIKSRTLSLLSLNSTLVLVLALIDFDASNFVINLFVAELLRTFFDA